MDWRMVALAMCLWPLPCPLIAPGCLALASRHLLQVQAVRIFEVSQEERVEGRELEARTFHVDAHAEAGAGAKADEPGVDHHVGEGQVPELAPRVRAGGTPGIRQNPPDRPEGLE